jgi:hypothetical protein
MTLMSSDAVSYADFGVRAHELMSISEAASTADVAAAIHTSNLQAHMCRDFS